MKRIWDATLKSWGWTYTRDTVPVDALVLTLELKREPGRFVEVLVPRSEAKRLMGWIDDHLNDEE